MEKFSIPELPPVKSPVDILLPEESTCWQSHILSRENSQDYLDVLHAPHNRAVPPPIPVAGETAQLLWGYDE
ncbi:MAG: hypothetical protein OWS74_09240, partial [Firmicutes bacterium]|nr:hypothetical protein [Bacillota bacterium]